MGAPRITGPQKQRYFVLRNEGFTQAAAARECGFSLSSAKYLEQMPANGQMYREAKAERDIPDRPIPLDNVSEGAKAAIADRTGFLFCKRYFGWDLVPAQQRMWETMEDLWDSPDREYAVVNIAPGVGKSTVQAAFAAKRIVMDRAIRILFISRAQSLAERNTLRVRRALERTGPADRAVATLAQEFGRFKPRQGGDVWKRDEFVVEQMDGSPIEEKEPTVSAFGFNSEWLGNRLELVLGDDLDSTTSTRNMEIVEKNREVFDNELEPRLEPGGLFLVAQQRLGPFDFSAHCLSKRLLPEDQEDDSEGSAQYRHVIFKAHYDEMCAGLSAAEQRKMHAIDAPPYPEGCLLAPNRLSWRDIRKAMNNRTRFKVVYQQENAAEDDALVQRIWVDGGRGADGVEYLGCWDKDRGAWELPSGLTAPLLGIITVDPSPTKYWSVQAYAYHPASEQRFLLEQHRERMEAPDFLDWSSNLNSFTGLADDWWFNFQRLGVPLTHVVVERNAAQRFMLQYDFFHRWQRLRGLNVLPHDTNRNKADPDYGIQMLSNVWKFGQIRLPGRNNDPGRIHALRLVDEVTRWPHVATDDCVLGQWFLEHNLRQIAPSLKELPSISMAPSWA